jgi:uncharacterized protein with NRDE domain
VVTNVRDPLAAQTGPSRGALVADFLRGRDPAAVHIDRLATVAGAYAPFNLLLADSDSLEYLGNHPAERQTLGPGVHGMSNGALDAPWPKTRRLMAALKPGCKGRQIPFARGSDGPRSGMLWPTNTALPTATCPTPASAWNASAG